MDNDKPINASGRFLILKMNISLRSSQPSGRDTQWACKLRDRMVPRAEVFWLPRKTIYIHVAVAGEAGGLDTPSLRRGLGAGTPMKRQPHDIQGKSLTPHRTESKHRKEVKGQCGGCTAVEV